MAGHGQKLTRKQEQAVAALLAEPTLARAAAAAGVSLRTVKYWLRDPAFAGAYREVRRQVVEHAVGLVQQAAGEAVDTLKRLLSCGHRPTEARAAEALFDYALRGVEVGDLLERIEELERLAKGEGDEPGRES